jgi:hypothetical protein
VQTKAFIHTINVTSAYRLFTEIQEGMKIIDLVTPFVKITDPGSSDLLEGQVCDANEFQSFRRAIAEEGGTQPSSVPINLCDLDQVHVIIDEEHWVQQQVGERLAKVWDSVFSGYKLSQSLLLRRAT